MKPKPQQLRISIVADSIEKHQHIHYPATILHDISNARFFLTQGAAKLLHERQVLVLKKREDISKEQFEKIIINCALEKRKSIDLLNLSDLQKSPIGKILLKKRREDIDTVKMQVTQSLKQKIEAGTRIWKNSIYLHTEPHHDDIMLGYLPGVVRHIREHSTRHYFVTFTSGFTAVINRFMLEQLVKLNEYLNIGLFHELLDRLFRSSECHWQE